MTMRDLRNCGILTLALVGCLSLSSSAEVAPKEVRDPTPAWPAAIQQRNAEMKRRVDVWLAEGREARMPLHVVYFTCSDQEPFPEHRERLDRVLTEIQTWFADQHESLGFGRTTIALERDQDGKVRLHEAQLPFAVTTRRSANTRETRDECVRISRLLLGKDNIDFDNSFVLMLTTIPDDHGAAPYFGHPHQTKGSCFAVDTPWLDSKYTQTDGAKVWKGKPIGPANSALVGGIAHELVHGFGLFHCDEGPALAHFGESLMGSGNYTWRQERRGEGRGSFLLDGDAMQLIGRPPFTGRLREFDRKPEITISDLRLEALDEGPLRVSGNLQSDVPVYGLRLFDDPPGNGDYNAVAHVVLPDEQTGRFEITFRPLEAVGEHELRLYAYHVNGRWTKWTNVIIIDGAGRADLSKTAKQWSR